MRFRVHGCTARFFPVERAGEFVVTLRRDVTRVVYPTRDVR